MLWAVSSGSRILGPAAGHWGLGDALGRSGNRTGDKQQPVTDVVGRLELIRFVLSSQTNHEAFARELAHVED